MLFSTGTQWYALYTKIAQESRVRDLLSSGRMEIEDVILPLDRIRQRNRSYIVRAAFPRYLFCKTDLSDSYYDINTTPGVVSLVGVSNTACAIEEQVIDDLKQQLDVKGYVKHAPASLSETDRFQVGRKVEIRQGIWSGRTGEYQGLGRDGMALVLIAEVAQLTGRPLTIEHALIRVI